MFPHATIFHLVFGVALGIARAKYNKQGSNANGGAGIGSVRLFGYQLVGISKSVANRSCCGLISMFYW